MCMVQLESRSDLFGTIGISKKSVWYNWILWILKEIYVGRTIWFAKKFAWYNSYWSLEEICVVQLDSSPPLKPQKSRIRPRPPDAATKTPKFSVQIPTLEAATKTERFPYQSPTPGSSHKDRITFPICLLIFRCCRQKT